MEKKMRYSHQREMIYDYLASSFEHPTAEMVYESLKADIPNLSLGTVYRNLKLLESMGKIRRVTTLQNVERYDARCGDHAHFVCECCGKVKDLKVLDAGSAGESCCIDSGDSVNWVSVVFGGACAECAAKKENPNT